jgi:uncharacterized protein (TIGR03663 family)
MQQKPKWLDRPVHPALPAITVEILVFFLIILFAVVTRFYNLGIRVMSHDESLHTYFSWLLYRGQGYQHTPMMHGPWQFHWIALSYFLFGVSDFTARIPAALFGIASIGMVWYWRHFLGKTGALIAGIMMVISPYLLFYSRYVREDMYAVFAGILLLYAVLRYLETGRSRYLFIMVAALVIHYLDKETSFIFSAQLWIFLAIYFIARVTRSSWTGHEREYRLFMVVLAIGILLLVATAGAAMLAREATTISGTETAAPANPAQTPASPFSPVESGTFTLTVILGVLAGAAIIAALYFLIRGYGWQRILAERSFDLFIVNFTLILPLLTSFVLSVLERWIKVTIPTDGPSVQNLTSTDIVIIAIALSTMFAITIIVGWIWRKDLWWKLALTFWVPFTVFYTTFFTNSDGFFTGTLGSLGYWLVQQGVERGSQPWYYYLLVQIPMYEFLPALGLILALFLGLRRRTTTVLVEAEAGTAHEPLVYEPAAGEPLLEDPAAAPVDSPGLLVTQQPQAEPNFTDSFSLLVWWSIATIITLSYAGERMPWLTVHMAWPMVFLTGWAIGQLIDTTDWQAIRRQKVLLTLGTVIIFIASLANALLNWGLNPPFQGKELVQLQATSAFLLPAIVAVASAVALIYLLRGWTAHQVSRVFAVTVFAFLLVITARTALRAAYINYDNATEFLVYAHGATGIKQVMAQAREISERSVGGLNVAIAYDASAPDTGVSWPFVWYLRDYTNQRSFDAPTRSLRDSVIVIVDSKNFDKIDAALGPNFYRIDYIRMWWPMQDYFAWVTPRDSSLPFDPNYSCKGLFSFFRLFRGSDYSRICNGLTDPQIRAGLVDIWWNRDYTRYAQALGRNDLTLPTWQPADQMRMYIRKDVASQIWNYGVGPVASETVQDPTEGKQVQLSADLVIEGSQIPAPGLNSPRSLAFARDGSFYVADSLNHRILHLDENGALLKAWGSFAQGTDTAPAPPGTFNEPWGVAVGPDGSVYVTDTWNHRVQKFAPDGRPLLQWGHFGQADSLDALYGPRGIAADSEGKVYVADTGNKRIVVFDSEGNPITEIGTGGFDPGQFDEPVGVAVDSAGRLYVADTWNQRIQTFIASPDGLSFSPDSQWDVYGWFGQSLENKPFIAVDGRGRVFITDPEGYRVMEFSNTGELLQVWGDYGATSSTFGLPSGIAVDPQDRVWVTDSASHRILRFTLP